MVASWLGINRPYFNKFIKQYACHKPYSNDHSDFQALTVVAELLDSGSDKNTDIECKKLFIICVNNVIY
jgi:hypothetical protein